MARRDRPRRRCCSNFGSAVDHRRNGAERERDTDDDPQPGHRLRTAVSECGRPTQQYERRDHAPRMRAQLPDRHPRRRRHGRGHHCRPAHQPAHSNGAGRLIQRRTAAVAASSTWSATIEPSRSPMTRRHRTATVSSRVASTSVLPYWRTSPKQDVQDVGGRVPIETRRRFVREYERRSSDHRPGHREPATLTGGESRQRSRRHRGRVQPRRAVPTPAGGDRRGGATPRTVRRVAGTRRSPTPSAPPPIRRRPRRIRSVAGSSRPGGRTTRPAARRRRSRRRRPAGRCRR